MPHRLAVGLVGFAFARRHERSLLGEPMRLSVATRIDRRLLAGALAFGAGWGLAGFCPSPVLVAFAARHWKAALFVAAMLAGMAIFEALERHNAA